MMIGMHAGAPPDPRTCGGCGVEEFDEYPDGEPVGHMDVFRCRPICKRCSKDIEDHGVD